MAIRSNAAVVSAVILLVPLLGAQSTPAPKAVQTEVQRHIEKVISCLPAEVVVKDDPHSCTTLAQQMAALHVSGVSIAVIHNGSIERRCPERGGHLHGGLRTRFHRVAHPHVARRQDRKPELSSELA